MTKPFDAPVCISTNNSKIGKIYNMSLPPKIACPKGVPCYDDGCYARKAWDNRSWPSVRIAWGHNWTVLTNDFDRYFRSIRDQLFVVQPPYFRWHVGGDIPSQRYLDGMIKVAEELPRINMVAFTKNYSLNLDKLPDNLSVIPSFWPAYGQPEKFKNRPVAWVYDKKNEDERISGHYFICNDGCDQCYACWHIKELDKDVVFHKH